MYRHTTPHPLDDLLQNDPDSAGRVVLIDSEREAETVWGDYPGSRTGNGKYCDISLDGVPVGRLWATASAVGLLHVAVPVRAQRFESELQYWNAAMDIRKSFHDGVSAAAAFDSVLVNFQSTAVVSGDVSAINFPATDALYYQGRYDPSDTYIWCKEMQ